MDGPSGSKKTKPENAISSMFEKKFKAMETSATSPNSTQESSKDSSSSPQITLPAEATGMESGKEPSAMDNQLVKSDEVVKTEFDTCLAMSIKCLRFLLGQGLELSGPNDLWLWALTNEGGLFELLKFLATQDEESRQSISKNAIQSYQITPLELQKNLIRACAKATTKLIVQDLGDDYFGIIVDGSRDKEDEYHLSLYLRYVDKRGMVIERFLGMVGVDNFSAMSCKTAIDSLLVEHSLSPCNIRGQSYNGANSLAEHMNSDINCLKSLIMKKSQFAYHSHCFSHQLHMTLTVAAWSCDDCVMVFMRLADLLTLTLVRDSLTRPEMLQDTQAQKVLEALRSCELEIRKYAIKEFNAWRPYDCLEYDNYKTLLNVVTLFTTIVEVLDLITEISTSVDFKVKAENILSSFLTFEFVFLAHLMKTVLGCTNELNLALERRDQDIATVISLVPVVKNQLQRMRLGHEWENLINEVSSVCVSYDIEVPDMNADYASFRRSKFFLKQLKPSTNLEHYRGEVYFGVIDRQLQVLNNLFDDTTMELLSYMACLNPTDCFSSFDKQKLIRLAEFYPEEFSAVDLKSLEIQLDMFIADMRSDDRFRNLKDFAELSVKLVETKKHDLYSNVYLLLKLMLILPVATPSIERTVSGMNFVKYRLLNSVADQHVYDSLTTFVEREVFPLVIDDDIISCLKNIKTSQD